MNKIAKPIYSIIIPVKNNPTGLEITLNSILRDPQLSDHEIIVANDDADPKVSKVIETYKKEGIPISEVLIQKSKGAYYARNRAIEISKGEAIIFFDDEMKLPGNWFYKLNPYIEEHDYIAGKVKVEKKEGENVFEKYYRLNAFPFEDYFNRLKFGGTGFLMVKKKVFNTIGLFEETLVAGADCEFGQRVHQHQYKTVFFNKYSALHQPKSLKKQIKTTLRDTKGNYQLYLLQPQKFPNFRISLYTLSVDIYYWLYSSVFFRNSRVYMSEEISVMTYLLMNTFNRSVLILSKFIVLTFPGKKFNY